MPVILPVSFLVAQAAFYALFPSLSGPVAYVVMVLAPLLAAAAAPWRARREDKAARLGWRLLALSLVIWALGAFGNLWHELVLGRANEMYRSAMLAFNLSLVPVAFVLASDWWPEGRRFSRGVDALLALALCQGFFLYTWAMLTARGAPDEAGVALMVWLLDGQQLFLTVGTLVRWRVAQEAAERRLFQALALYEAVYLLLLVLNNHFIAGDPAFGPQISSAITLVFAVLAACALQRPGAAASRQPNPALVRAVRSARPFVLPGALLIVSLFLIRVDYAYGAAGIVIAVLGYGLRNAAAEVRYIERGEVLQRERSALQNIAWTDALTGVPNRHFLDDALRSAARRELRNTQPLAVLMIDIDHFKQLNDRYGHPAGDDCLRDVARVLQQALVRPGDVLARYGGEEFIALLHDADGAGALVVAERLRAAVEAQRIAHQDSPFGVVTVSVGAASALLDDGDAAQRLVQAADRALYEAKCAGRNRVGRLAVAASAAAPIG